MTLIPAGVPSSAWVVPDLIVTISSEGISTVIALQGECDISTVPALEDSVAQVVADSEGPVIIDLAETSFIDTATARAIDGARQILGGHGRLLTIRSPSRQTAAVLRYFGMSDLVRTAPLGGQ